MVKENVIIPNGFIIDLYKFLDTTTEDHSKMEEFYKDKEKEFHKFFERRELAYGHYDRIQFRPVKHFSEYTELTSRTYNWLGTSQSILVFPLTEKENERVFAYEGTSESTSVRIRTENDTFSHCNGFITASFCYISDEARYRFKDYRQLLSFCRDTIIDLIDAYNQKAIQYHDPQSVIKAEVFGTFSSAEIVVLCSAKQYVDILYLVDSIKDFQAVNRDDKDDSVNIFRSTYTTISYPDNLTEYDEDKISALFKDAITIKGEALIGIGMQENTDTDYFENVKKYINESLINVSKMLGEKDEPFYEILFSAGEYDFVVKTKSRYISRLFHKPYIDNDDADKNLNIHNERFHRFFLNTSTRLCYDESDLPDFTSRKDWKNEIERLCKRNTELNNRTFNKQWRSKLIKNLWEKNRKRFDNLQKKVKACFPAVSSFSVVLDQMFSDYVQCCSTTADYIWIQDYNVFIEKVLQLLEFYLDDHFMKGKGTGFFLLDHNDCEDSGKTDHEDNNSSDVILEEMTRLVESVEQQTNHIAVSSKLFFKEQNAHFGYTAQYDLVIHAYYGMIKELMEEIFSHQSSPEEQSRLFPLINFRPVHAIASEMFIESGKPSECDGERIIIFRLPLDAMDNILHYTPMLIHEVYHYAAPLHRKGRNEYLTLIGVFSLLRESICKIFRCNVDDTLAKSISDKSRLTSVADVDEGDFESVYKLIDIEDLANLICSVFVRIAEDVIINTLDKNKDAVFLDISRYHYKKKEDEILRSWHLKALDGWLFIPMEDVIDDHNGAKRISFENLLQLIVLALRESLIGIIDDENAEFLADLTEEEREYFFTSVKTFLEQMNEAGSPSKDFMQEILDSADKSYSNTVEDVFFQLDEILPDCAMVSFTGMSISGYLLQIAINHDVNFYEINALLPTDQLRYGLVIDWILARAERENIQDTLQEELEQFNKYYRTVYRMQTSEEDYHNEVITEKAERWSEYFLSCFSDYSSSFHAVRPWLMELIGKHLEPIIKDCSNQFADIYRGYLKVLNAKEEDKQNLLFEANLDTIKRFQAQKLITEINAVTDAETAMRPLVYRLPELLHRSDYEYRITNYAQIHYTIDWILNKMHEYRRIENCKDYTGMWFRGVENAEFSILPSGFVHFYEDCEFLQGKCQINASNYLSCQRRIYENFRYAADGAPEHHNPSFYTEIDHLALMQHYQQHTNLLDWSEDVDTGLYFALESEIVVNEKYCNIQDNKHYLYPDKDAVVYILDPVRFNRACREMEKELECLAPQVCDDLNHFDQIPNLSVLKSEDHFREYYDFYKTAANNNWIELDEHADKFSLRYIKDTDNILQGRLPRAVYTSKINPRLKAQSGMFVAFSLMSRPAYISGQSTIMSNKRTKLFDYQSINELQDLYLRLGVGKGGRNPFLYRIIIPKELKRLIGRRLHRLGFSKEKFYPEIQNHHSR